MRTANLETYRIHIAVLDQELNELQQKIQITQQIYCKQLHTATKFVPELNSYMVDSLINY